MAGDLAGLLDRARAASTLGVDVRFGPIPLHARAATKQSLDDVEAHAAADRLGPRWPPLDVSLLDGDALPAETVPELLRPVDHGPTYVCRDGVHLAVADSSMLWVVDAGSRWALRWTARPETLPVWESMRPLRFALRWAAVHQGGALVHTAAVAGERGAALLVGAAGAGKSTTTFACLGRGLDVLGDDYCLVEREHGQTVVHSTYLLGTLDDRSLSMLPHLRERVVAEGLRGKSLVRLDRLADGTGTAPAVALCAVVQAPGEPTRLVPTSRVGVLRALAPSTMFQIAGLQRETWEAMVAALRDLPAFELRVGSLDEVAPVLAEHLGGPRSGAGV